MEATSKLKMTPYSLILTLSILFFAYFHPTSSAELCNPSDKTTLLKTKAYFGSYDPYAFPDWDPKSDCCGWSNVRCDGSTGRVTSLYINASPNRTLSLPPVIGDLVYLESLRSGFFNSLRGPIPSSFAKLTRLQTLDLSRAGLSGPIPDFLGRFTRLDYLSLNANKFSGSIPSSLGQLKELTYLDMGENQLSGPIPDSLGRLTELYYLRLTSNRLSGPIPPSLSHLTKADRIDLQGNRLTGSVPASFGSFNYPGMALFVGSNRLGGPLPRSLGSINISLIDLSSNRFTGDASFLFGREKTAMDRIFLGDNRFKFVFSNVEFPIALRYLEIENNQIYGSLPKQLGQLPLHGIDVSNNKLCGPIPTGRRLKRFSPDNFANNSCLCGLPLPPCK